MSGIGTRARAAIFALSAVLASAVAVGAQQRPAQPAPRQPPPPTIDATGPASGWIKVCQRAGDREGCVVQQEIYGESGGFLASVAIQMVTGEARRRVVMTLPFGLWIEDGVQVRVDQRPPIPAPFGTCLANGCFAAVDLTPELLQNLRQGQRLTLAVRPPDASIVNIPFALTNFAAIFDGPGADAAALQAHQERFDAEVRRFVEAANQRAQNPTPVQPPPRPQR